MRDEAGISQALRAESEAIRPSSIPTTGFESSWVPSQSLSAVTNLRIPEIIAGAAGVMAL
jgi:hypothetical protein